MIPDNLNQYEKGKARYEWVKANRHHMSISEMAKHLGTAENTVRYYIRKMDKTGEFAEKPKAKQSKYYTWECHKPKKYLADNFRGLF